MGYKEKIELSIYGDNILECERMFELIESGFNSIQEIQVDLSHIYSPLKKIKTSDKIIEIQFYPDYKSKTRWHKKGLLNILLESGANLTEAPDIILTKKNGEKETIILAIEFSSALPAGNQAWQRSGRALSFSEVHIPYLYITDIGLEELDSERQSKAVRSSNPLVPLSYIKNTQRSASFTLSVLNPSQLLALDEDIEKFIVNQEVINMINGLILGNNITPQIEKLIAKTANYLNSYEKTPENVDFKEWIATDDKDIEKLISSLKLPKYNKKIASKTPIKDEMKILIKDIIPETAISIYNNLPICFITADKKKAFSDNIKSKCYPDLKSEVFDWLEKETPSVVCFINGFKPRGDDARPDRGLVPFARMLFGFEIDLLALVFGQAPKFMEPLFSENPILLSERNGLWKSVLYYSSLTIADSCHWKLDNENISNFSLIEKRKEKSITISIDKPSRVPIKFNENDIDTAIHLTFQTNKFIFESLCNPPGGDWSGISLIDTNKLEHRWMSLPRVSVDAKRPDHIFQISKSGKEYLLIIESKENLNGLIKDQVNLGVGLIKYVTDLISYPASAIKDNESNWNRNNELIKFNQTYDEIFSVAAFIITKPDELEKAKSILNVDFIIGFDTDKHSLSTKIVNKKGRNLKTILDDIKIKLD
jgi:hypothetical protein